MPAISPSDHALSKDIHALHRSVRFSILVFIVCSAVMAAIFIFYANRLQSISEAQEMLMAETYASAVSVVHAESILSQIKRARTASAKGEHVDPILIGFLDDIERLATRIIERQD